MRQGRDRCSVRLWLRGSVSHRKAGWLTSALRIQNCLPQDVRERLYRLIRKHSRVATVTIHAHEIDAIRRGMTMNACIARAHAEVINRLSPSRAYVDACDVNCFRYAEMVKEHLTPECEIVSEHHADEKFMVVSAASIVAKVIRDRAIAKLGKEYGEIGSGYPSDPVTVQWLTGYIRKQPVPTPYCTAQLEDGRRSSCKKVPAQPHGLLTTPPRSSDEDVHPTVVLSFLTGNCT